jgi:hypothetical protein
MDGVEICVVRELIKQRSILVIGHYPFPSFTGFDVALVGLSGAGSGLALFATPEQNSSFENSDWRIIRFMVSLLN